MAACWRLYARVSIAWLSYASSEPVATVLITGLGTTGAIKQKQFFRFIGSAPGGVVRGIGAVVFLFPHMDSVDPLVVLVAGVMFAAACIARSLHLGYVGMQMGFSFCLIALSGPSTPVNLAPTWDRVAGVGLALIIMWFVCHAGHAGPSAALRSAVIGRHRFGAPDREAMVAQSRGVRTLIANEISSIRKLAEVAPYEFGTNREREQRVSDGILEIERAALAIERQSTGLLAAILPAEELAPGLDGIPHGEHVRSVIARYREFRTILPVFLAPAE